MMIDRYKSGDTVFGNWKLVRLIGEGSFGQVFEAEREDFGRIYKAAIKIITIPQSQSEIQSIQADGLDAESVTAYFRGFVEELVDEFAIMSQLKGHSNIVSYEDHTVQPHTGDIGWDILIRMELLTPLLQHIRESGMTQRDVIQLGIDMCKALELCQKYKIVHRDIKPENIFISPAGDYKLGDFGIARTVEKTTSGLSKKGTYTYMAPEIYRGQPYGTTVDIYSLGIVLYWLLNESRSPFLPAYPAPITHTDRENALRNRICGAPIPAPKNAEGRLAEIVLKACSFDPKDRYSSPMQMRQELEGILYAHGEAPFIFPEGDEVPARSAHEIPTDESTELMETDEPTMLLEEEEPTERTENIVSVLVDDKAGPFDPIVDAAEQISEAGDTFDHDISESMMSSEQKKAAPALQKAPYIWRYILVAAGFLALLIVVFAVFFGQKEENHETVEESGWSGYYNLAGTLDVLTATPSKPASAVPTPLPGTEPFTGSDAIASTAPTAEATASASPTVAPLSSSPSASFAPVTVLSLSSIDFTLSPKWPTYQMKVTGATGKVTYSVDTPGVVTVSDNGLVTAVANGYTVLTVTDEAGASAKCDVRVADMPKTETPAPTDNGNGSGSSGSANTGEAMLSTTDFDLSQKWGYTAQLTVSGGTAVDWSSSNEQVATVSGSGLVTGVAKGTATITCTLSDGSQLTAIARVR